MNSGYKILGLTINPMQIEFNQYFSIQFKDYWVVEAPEFDSWRIEEEIKVKLI